MLALLAVRSLLVWRRAAALRGELARERDFIEAVVQTTASPVVVTDPSGRIRELQDALARAAALNDYEPLASSS